MKTIRQINSEIINLTNTLKSCIKSQKSRLNMRIQQLKQYKLYLETGVTEEFLEKQLKELQEKILRRDKEFEAYVPPNGRVNKRKEYEKKMGYTEINRRIKVLKYLLNH